MSKASREWKITLNSSVYKKSIKQWRSGAGLIHCDFCMYHRGENESRRSPKVLAKHKQNYPEIYKNRNVSWKAASRRRRQYNVKTAKIGD